MDGLAFEKMPAGGFVGINEFIEKARSLEQIAPSETNNDYLEAYDIKPEIRHDIPGYDAALVSGDPYGVAPLLDFKQGDNPYKAYGNCCLVSISNMLQIAGIGATEDDVTSFALNNKLCRNGLFVSNDARGAADDRQMIKILEHYGIEASSFRASGIGGGYESIAKSIESGRGVLMGLNSGYLWDDPRRVNGIYGEVYANHQVIVTGSARDASTGKVIGFYICDSGNGDPKDACRYVPISLLDKAYINANTASVIITEKPLRG